MQPRPDRLDVYYGSDLVGAVHDSVPLAFEYASTWLDGAQRMSLAAIPLQVPIQSGFWSMLAVAPLIWTVCATPGSRRTDLAAIALLCLASGVSVGRLDPDNLGLWLVVLVVSVGGGLIVGRSRRHTADSQLVAELRRGELAVLVAEVFLPELWRAAARP